MLAFELIAERKIAEAAERGDFDDLLRQLSAAWAAMTPRIWRAYNVSQGVEP